MDHTVSNLIRIQEEINSKNSKNNQNISTKIIAVSKTFSENKIYPLIEYGHNDFGENKVQEAMDKWVEIKKKIKDLNLHMIGKLQTNKVKQAVKIFDYIHSVDSIKLAKKISDEQKKIEKNIKIFIQINIGEENQKSGVNLSDFEKLYDYCKNELKLDVIGLMCIPPNNDNPEKYFSQMFEIKKKFNLKDLSMGMSSDYLLAMKYGSTYVRIGSRIFGARN
jgi:pyridoxal phosphate enzyme (YggS family)